MERYGRLRCTILKFRDKSMLAFLKMDLILRTTVDMAVGSVAYSWQENSSEKGTHDPEGEGAAPGSLAEQGRCFRASVSVTYIKSTFVWKYLRR